MAERERDERLDDTEIRRDTQVRGSLGVPPSGMSEDEWCEQEGCDEPADREQARGQSTEQPRNREEDRDRSRSEDDDRMSER